MGRMDDLTLSDIDTDMGHFLLVEQGLRGTEEHKVAPLKMSYPLLQVLLLF